MNTVAAVRAIAGVVALEAVRGRLPWLMAVVVLGGIGLAEFTADVAITESREIARGMLGAWLRLASVFVLALFVVTSMVRDFNDKGTELVLALALPRAAYLVGRLAGYAMVAVASTLVCTGVLLLYAPAVQALVWGATLGCELLLVAALAALCVLTLGHVTLGMSAVIGFYLLSRVMEAIQLIGSNPLAGGHSFAHQVMSRVLDGIAFLLPDLDRFARSEWLIHGNAGAAELGAALLQTAVYLLLLVGAGLFDLERKVL